MTSANALAVKLWSAQAFSEMLRSTFFGHALKRNILRRESELDRAQAGDQITLSFVGRLNGLGFTEGDTLEGNEEALDTEGRTLQWNVVRNAVAMPNKDTIEQQRTFVNFPKEARDQLRKWHAKTVDASFFNQLAGVNSTTITVEGAVYSGAKRTIVQGLNTVDAPTSNRIIRAGGAATDEALTSADTFTLDLVDVALELAGRTDPAIEALDGEEFDLFLSYEQYTDLKRDASGKITWYTNYSNALAGGMIADNPIMASNGLMVKPVGKYANVNIYAARRVATGQNSSTSAAIPTVKRAILCGLNAGSIASKFSGAFTEATGEKMGDVPLKFFTQLKDYDYNMGLEARMMYGLRKNVFGGEDFGSIVISTYAAAHTS
jgi:hypothetical protein